MAVGLTVVVKCGLVSVRLDCAAGHVDGTGDWGLSGLWGWVGDEQALFTMTSR